MDQYSLCEKLGSGNFGEVFLALNNLNEKVVVKRYMQDHMSYHVLREINIIRSVNHPNIIKYLDIYQNGKGIVLEYGGINLKSYYNLTNFIERIDNLKNISYQIISGLIYLHEVGIIHRDIKPDNILIKTEEKKIIVKICDFGVSKKISKSNSYEACSLNYKSIELLTLDKKNYTISIDVWALACTLYEYIVGKKLFSGKTELAILTKILGTVPVLPEDLNTFGLIQWKYECCNSEKFHKLPQMYNMDLPIEKASILINFQKILCKMLVLNPDQRIKLNQILNDKFYDSLEIEKINLNSLLSLYKINQYQNFNIRQKLPKRITEEIRKNELNFLHSFLPNIEKETILVSVNMFDKCIKIRKIIPIRFITICCLSIASKYIDNKPITIKNKQFKDNYGELLKIEENIIQNIDFNLLQPTFIDVYKSEFGMEISDDAWKIAWDIMINYDLLKNKGFEELKEIFLSKIK